jgi:hypothetical protein
MRPKFVLTLLVLAALVLAAAYHFRPQTALTTAALPPPPVHADLPAASNSILGVRPKPITEIPQSLTPEQKQAYIFGEMRRLQDLSTKNDPESFSAILNDLTNSEKEVRLAAIEATKQVGNRDAIPVLKANVAGTTDTDEQIALLQAANFLSLPTIADSDVQAPKTPEQTQAAQQRQAQEAARKQAQLQQKVQMLQQQAQVQQQDQNPPAGPNN